MGKKSITFCENVIDVRENSVLRPRWRVSSAAPVLRMAKVYWTVPVAVPRVSRTGFRWREARAKPDSRSVATMFAARSRRAR